MTHAPSVAVARALWEWGEACVQWDSFGRCWSVWSPTALGVGALFLEVGPRAFNAYWEAMQVKLRGGR